MSVVTRMNILNFKCNKNIQYLASKRQSYTKQKNIMQILIFKHFCTLKKSVVLIVVWPVVFFKLLLKTKLLIRSTVDFAGIPNITNSESELYKQGVIPNVEIVTGIQRQWYSPIKQHTTCMSKTEWNDQNEIDRYQLKKAHKTVEKRCCMILWGDPRLSSFKISINY